MKKFINQKNGSAIVILLALNFIYGCNANINSVLNQIAAQFPDVSPTTIQLLATIPFFIVMIGSIVVGATIGKKIKYKPTIITGFAIYIIGEALPVFISNSFPLLLGSRILCGIGGGMITCGTAYTYVVSDVDRIGGNVAAGNAIMNVAGIVFMFLAGVLGGIKWNYVFIPVLVGIIPLILSFKYLVEPQIADAPAAQDEGLPDKAASEEKLSPKTWIYAVVLFLVNIGSYCWMLVMSDTVFHKGIESVFIVSLVLVFARTGGIIGSAAFGKLDKYGSKAVILSSGIIGILGSVAMLYAKNVVLLCLLAVLNGVSYYIGVVMCFGYNGLANSKAKAGVANMILNVSQSISLFICPFFVSLATKLFSRNAALPTSGVFIGSAVVMAIVFVIGLLFDVSPGAKPEA